MVRPWPLACLLTLLLAALPAAHAQAGANDPKVTLSVEVTPKTPTIPLGGLQSFKVDVRVVTQNIFCSSAGTLKVELAIKDTGLPGVAGTLPSTLDVPVAANVNPASATATANSGGNATARLEVTVARSAAPDHEHGFTVTANSKAELPMGCQALSTVPPPAATATADVAIKTGPAPASASGTGSGGVAVSVGNCSASVSAPGVAVNASGACPTAQKSFAVPLQLQVAALLGVALLRRRLA